MNSPKPRLAGILAGTALALLTAGSAGAVPARSAPPAAAGKPQAQPGLVPGLVLVQDEGGEEAIPRRRRQNQAEQAPQAGEEEQPRQQRRRNAQAGEQPAETQDGQRQRRAAQQQQGGGEQQESGEQPRRRRGQAAEQPEAAPQAGEAAEQTPRARRQREQPAEQQAAPERSAPAQAQSEPRQRRQPAGEQPGGEAAPAEAEGTPVRQRRRNQPEATGEQQAQPEETEQAPRRRDQAAQQGREEPAEGRAAPAGEEAGEASAAPSRREGNAQPEQARPGEARPETEQAGRESPQRRRDGQGQTEENAELPPGEAPSANARQRDANRGGSDGGSESENRRPREAEADNRPPPSDDRAAQAAVRPERVEPVDSEEGTGRRESRDGDRDEERRRERPSGADVVRELGDRLILRYNDQVLVESSDRPRLNRNARDVYTEDLPRQRTRETIVRGDGTRVVTVRDRYGDVIRRSRITPDGREYVLNYVDENEADRRDWRDPGLDLPPFRPNVPQEDYILDAERAPSEEDYYDFLEKPPVEQVERLYSLDEVKRSARVRQKTRRVDLDTITFDFGSAAVPESQIQKLDGVASAMERLLQKNPGETFLIEGHTDAVGSDEANLALSDRRAEAVAEALTNVFAIPPENLATQGYGEQYLKVQSSGPEQENRRVAIRRITPLVAPATASAQ
jgi:outer membrane protein OmpA-like peptidoglycan-associated protein